ncbi:hypothetical protein BDW75DRAFT_207412 [Aspergillus navahoensis]
MQQSNPKQQAPQNQFRSTNHRHNGRCHLPDFMKTFEVRGAEELEVLRRWGVFDPPPPQLQQAALDKYEEIVHPAVPIMNCCRVS